MASRTPREKMAFRGLRTIKHCNAGEWLDMKLSVYAGNLIRGSQIRELRCDLQVTLTELADWLWDNTPDDFYVTNISCLSRIELGLRSTTEEEFRTVKRAIRLAAREEKPKERRRLKHKREVYEGRRAA